VNPDDVDVRISADGGWQLATPARGLRVDGGVAEYAAPQTRDLDLRVAVVG